MGPLLIVRPFRASDLEALAPRLQPAQQAMVSYFQQQGYAEQLSRDPSFTLDAADLPVAAAGITPMWDSRAFAWALITVDAGKHMRTLTRAVLRFLNGCPVRRIEAYVAPDFPAAIRWMQILGFSIEGRMRAFTPEGHDCFMYARIKGLPEAWPQHP